MRFVFRIIPVGRSVAWLCYSCNGEHFGEIVWRSSVFRRITEIVEGR